MSKSELPRKALGKGLHSLLPARNQAAPPPEPTPTRTEPLEGQIQMLPLHLLRANLNQPRAVFDDEALQGLARSISKDGILQPIIVRKWGPNYQVIAGERRMRAANIVGLKEVPVIVRDVEEDRLMELALIENIQREDLAPIDLARAFEKMVEQLGLSHQEIGERTGKDRATITNSLRLLQLAEPVQRLLDQNKIAPGHARALLRIEDPEIQVQVAERCANEGWSVRQIEEFAKPRQTKERRDKKPPQPLDPNVKAAISELEETLGTRVRIVEKSKGKGQIEIEYYSGDDLNRIYEIILR